MTLPTITLNGTSRDTLVEQRCNVLYHLRTAEDALTEACPNGRDYFNGQHALAVTEWRDRLATLRGLIAEIETEALKISEA